VDAALESRKYLAPVEEHGKYLAAGAAEADAALTLEDCIDLARAAHPRVVGELEHLLDEVDYLREEIQRLHDEKVAGEEKV
jgi:hypothetical protein